MLDINKPTPSPTSPARKTAPSLLQSAREARLVAARLPPRPGHELPRLVERLHRRFLDVVRLELGRLGVDDISPVQALMLMTIGGEEMSVRDLIERGHYLGSNASYNLKHLVETGYVDRAQSARDRRSARLRVSQRGAELCEGLRAMEAAHFHRLARTEEERRDVETTYRTLRRLERSWTELVRYDGGDLD